MRLRFNARLRTAATVAGLATAFALTFASSASAAVLPEPSVSPGIDVSHGFHPTTITISGTGCLPQPGHPASVTLTIDGMPGTATATPAADGTWAAHVLITTQDARGIHAVCHNSLGSTEYAPAVVIFYAIGATSSSAPTPTTTTASAPPAATGTPTTDNDPLASTGSNTGPELVIGLALLAGGAGLVWVGRRRGAKRAS